MRKNKFAEKREQDQERFEQFLESYEGCCISTLTDRLDQLEDDPSADKEEIKAIKQILKNIPEMDYED